MQTFSRSRNPHAADDRLAAVWVGATLLLAVTVLVLPWIWPSTILVNRAAGVVFLALSAFVHIVTAVWIRQRAFTSVGARTIGFANACVGVLTVVALWLVDAFGRSR